MDWKKFEWINLPFKELETIEGATRLYKVADGVELPSMTSILKILDDGGIDVWRKRVGEEEADRIVREAVERGNSLHDLSERYLKNELQRADVKGKGAVLFNRTRPILNELGPIVGIEVPLYSITHGFAGRTDCIAFHDSNLCIADHKNSRNQVDLSKGYAKKKIFKYLMQLYGYSIAFHEMFPLLPQPTHGLLIVGNFNTMNATKMKVDLREPWFAREFHLLVDSYYGRADVKDSAFFRL